MMCPTSLYPVLKPGFLRRNAGSKFLIKFHSSVVCPLYYKKPGAWEAKERHSLDKRCCEIVSQLPELLTLRRRRKGHGGPGQGQVVFLFIIGK